MKAAFLPDRGVIKVIGEDARHFLNNLVTSELDGVAPGRARFAALLTPQGKIIADFLVTEAPAGHGGGLLLDCPKELAAALATRLGFYKLRAKVTIENLSDNFGVMALWGGSPAMMPDLAFADPRNDALGTRVLVPQDLADKLAAAVGANIVDEAAYEAHRIACGVPRGGVDFKYGDAFPHETNMDRLHGVNFDKGCYIGQEVVSRTQHRGTARTRITRVTIDGKPETGSSVIVDGKSVGTMGSFADKNGLAMLRLDKVSDAIQNSSPLTIGDATIHLVDESEAKLPEKKALL